MPINTTLLLSPERDPMGRAIADYHKTKKVSENIKVLSSMFEEDEIPVKQLFRKFNQMPALERTALELATGKILDVGAGSGCHALALQEMSKEVCAIDISALSVETMREQGVKDAKQINFFNPEFREKFDTILMLMNGSGIVGKIGNMPQLFKKAKELLLPDGCIYMDSSDLRYLFEEEDGSFLIDLNGEYYGEVDYQMQYKEIKGDSFDWLYIDPQALELYANENGFEVEIIKEGKHYDYLAKITLAK